MSIVVDVGIHFVKATYELKGDGPLALTCYEVITALSEAINPAHYLNTRAVVRQLTADPAKQQILLQFASACVQPGLKHFSKMELLSDPHCVLRLPFHLHLSTSDVNCLSSFPFLFGNLDCLKERLPAYIAASEDISPDYNPLEFWRYHKDIQPSWAAELRKVILVRLSSTASKRVFSLLKVIWGATI